MSATPEQIAIDEKALEDAARALSELHIEASLEKGSGWRVAAHRGARAAITAYLSATSDAQAERVRVLERLAERIAGEAPFKEPSGSPSVAWPPNWSEDMRDTVTDMIQEAFDEGRSCAYWHLGQIADAALKAAP